MNLDANLIAQTFIEDVNGFKTNLWIIDLLTTEVMVKKLGYWKEFFQKIDKAPVEPNDDMCLKTLTDMDIFSVREEVEDFSQRV